MRLNPNLSFLDRAVRFAVGVLCCYVGFVSEGVLGSQLLAIAVGVFGVINIFAAFTSYCPVYAACGVNTHKTASQES